MFFNSCNYFKTANHKNLSHILFLICGKFYYRDRSSMFAVSLFIQIEKFCPVFLSAYLRSIITGSPTLLLLTAPRWLNGWLQLYFPCFR